MKPVAETPDYSVAEPKSLRSKYGIENRVERNNLPVFHIITDLPTDGALGVQEPHALIYHAFLRFDVRVERSSRFVFLPQIVRGRR